MNKIKASIGAIAAMTVLVACAGNDAANVSTTVASQVTASTSTQATTPPPTTIALSTAPPVAQTTAPTPRKTTTTLAAAQTATTIAAAPAATTTTTAAPATSTTHQVGTTYLNYSPLFSPSSLSIAVGDTVQFSIANHNVQWSSSGTTYVDPYSRTFTSAGSYPYVCTLHGGMSGVITVS